MKNYFYHFGIIVLTLILTLKSCNTTDKSLMEINGSVKGLRKGTLYLKKVVDSSFSIVDSFVIEKNEMFVLSSKIKDPEIFKIQLKKDDGDTLNDEIIFFGSTGKIQINTRLNTFESSSIIRGSKNNDLLEEYKSVSRKFNIQNLELIKSYLEAQKNQNNLLVDSFKKRLDNLTKRRYLYTLNFARSNANNIVSPYIMISEMSNANPGYMDTIAKEMTEEVKKSRYGKLFFEILERNRKLNK
ncbi:MAG: hypothetical protein CMC81_04640 [Flavobacteriaceae bacterium]|nr:hypothetical protein [Flavobacteriaceae bacterium]